MPVSPSPWWRTRRMACVWRSLVRTACYASMRSRTSGGAGEIRKCVSHRKRTARSPWMPSIPFPANSSDTSPTASSGRPLPSTLGISCVASQTTASGRGRTAHCELRRRSGTVWRSNGYSTPCVGRTGNAAGSTCSSRSSLGGFPLRGVGSPCGASGAILPWGRRCSGRGGVCAQQRTSDLSRCRSLERVCVGWRTALHNQPSFACVTGVARCTCRSEADPTGSNDVPTGTRAFGPSFFPLSSLHSDCLRLAHDPVVSCCLHPCVDTGPACIQQARVGCCTASERHRQGDGCHS